jgi:hypothetical protein
MSTIRDVVEMLERTAYGPLLRDPARRRQAVYDGLARSADPVAREIGEQLRDGRLCPSDLLRSPEFRSFLDRGAASLRWLDLDALARWADRSLASGRDGTSGGGGIPGQAPGKRLP